MQILVFQGSPRMGGNTARMCEAFAEGARAAGHTVHVLDVANMNIASCKGCLSCHPEASAEADGGLEVSLAPSDGMCAIEDDMEQIYSLWHEVEMMVFATPIYYGSPTPDILKVLHRSIAKFKPAKVSKTALFLTSLYEDVYHAARYVYHGYIQGYFDAEDMGVYTYAGTDEVPAEKLSELRSLGKSL